MGGDADRDDPPPGADAERKDSASADAEEKDPDSADAEEKDPDSADEAAVWAFYAAIDEGAYDRLRDRLDPGFVHRRPDRTLDGRERFVRFMREERPRTDTEHVLESVVAGDGEVFARGRLRTDDGDDLFGFVDVHRVDLGRILSLTTYTD